MVAALNLVLVAVTPILLAVLRRRPHRLAWIVNGFFALIFTMQLAETALFGGPLESGLVPGSLVAVSLKAAGGSSPSTSSPRASWSWPSSPTSPANATASSGDPTTCWAELVGC